MINQNQNNISLEKVLRALYGCANVQSEFTDAVYVCPTCPYRLDDGQPCESLHPLLDDAYALLKAQSEEITALRRLVEWSEECGFGLDSIFWEDYVKPEELEGKDYIEQLIYVAEKAGECDD